MSILIFGVAAWFIGYALELAAKHLVPADDPLVIAVNDLLPQTQCTQCGYMGCKPYARAIVKDNVSIELCPPGGQTTVLALSRLLGRDPISQRSVADETPRVAHIREADCVGCTLCIKACPVDAIIGAHDTMHSVIEPYCTGCELCVARCPMDCIEMVAPPHKSTAAQSIDNAPTEAAACIHCGRCNDICPLDLAAVTIYQLVRTAAIDAAMEKGLADCILCGACDTACPSNIPLSRFYREGKHQYRKLSEQRKHARQAQSRYVAHNTRMLQQSLQTQHLQQTQKERLKKQIKEKSTLC